MTRRHAIKVTLATLVGVATGVADLTPAKTRMSEVEVWIGGHRIVGWVDENDNDPFEFDFTPEGDGETFTVSPGNLP